MNQGKRALRVSLVFLALLPLFGLAGCTPAGSSGSASAAPYGAQAAAFNTQQQLQEITAERERDSFSTDFGIGPGDILEISIPDINQRKWEERVTPQGTIELPIAGSVNVDGLTEPQLNDAIAGAYSKYIKSPEVDVFVKNYVSREVAVVGMVNKPGLYTLNQRNETILDLIGQAGGLSQNAGSLIIFVPASRNQNAPALTSAMAVSGALEKPQAADSSMLASATSAIEAQPRIQQRAEKPAEKSDAGWQESGNSLPASWASANDAIFINFTSADQAELNVPVRPGDVIMVPARGSVLVQGWVPNPGAYPITPGMTALGAVTAAGGQLYSSSVLVLRAGPGGRKVQIPVDLSAVEKGKTADVPVVSGDVVIVQRSVVGAIPYGIYNLFNRFGTGLYFPAF